MILTRNPGRLLGMTEYTSLAGSLLKEGKLVAIPTETVYGLAANIFNPKAVSRVFAIKERPLSHPLIVHVPTLSKIQELIAEFPDKAKTLAQAFWPGPLTLVLRKSSRVPDIVTGGLPTVAIRIPNHPVALEILRLCEVPLAAPSANLFGRLSPTRAEHVREMLGAEIDLIVDGGPCSVGVESTIVGFSDDIATLLRAGGLALESIEQTIGKIERVAENAEPIAPGMLPKHYAPKTHLILWQEGFPLPQGKELGLLSFSQPRQISDFQAIEILSPSEDLSEAATNFFSALRRLDDRHLDFIVATSFPNTGLGIALNDRLRRAMG